MPNWSRDCAREAGQACYSEGDSFRSLRKYAMWVHYNATERKALEQGFRGAYRRDAARARRQGAPVPKFPR